MITKGAASELVRLASGHHGTPTLPPCVELATRTEDRLRRDLVAEDSFLNGGVAQAPVALASTRRITNGAG
jgi:hypothetical protein